MQALCAQEPLLEVHLTRVAIQTQSSIVIITIADGMENSDKVQVDGKEQIQIN